MKQMILISFICANAILSYSQRAIKKNKISSGELHALNIGDKVPQSVWNRIPRKKTTELVILDFWATSCGSCLAAFPHMAALQKEFDQKLQVVLVNPWENDSTIKKRMAMINKTMTTNGSQPYRLYSYVPSINGDTIFSHLFLVHSVPHHVWIDKSGKILYITGGYNATPNHVQRVLNGEAVKMHLKKDLALEGIYPQDGILKKADKSIIPVFYSCFTKYIPGFGSASGYIVDSADGIFRKYYFNSSVTMLYRSAFGFEYNSKILLEVKNKNDYKYPDWREEGDILDAWDEKNSFSYELAVPLSKQNSASTYMQQDLNRFFGNERGIEGLVEKRKLSCIILTGTGNDLLKTSGAENRYPYRDSAATWINRPYSTFSMMLGEKLEDMDAGHPFLDETGINPELKIDIQLTGDLKNIENVKKQLHKYGLDIIEAQREVEVLVIRDKEK